MQSWLWIAKKLRSEQRIWFTKWEDWHHTDFVDLIHSYIHLFLLEKMSEELYNNSNAHYEHFSTQMYHLEYKRTFYIFANLISCRQFLNSVWTTSKYLWPVLSEKFELFKFSHGYWTSVKRADVTYYVNKVILKSNKEPEKMQNCKMFYLK